jgi:hypothetical protein
MTIICPLPQDISFNHDFYKISDIIKSYARTRTNVLEKPNVCDSLKRKLETMTIENEQLEKPDVCDSLKRKLENMTIENEQNEIHIKKTQCINKYHIENILKRKFDQIKL